LIIKEVRPYRKNTNQKAITIHEIATKRESRVPIIEAKLTQKSINRYENKINVYKKMPANPFFSDRNHSRNFGTRRIYPHVQIINITKTMRPSNEYAKQKKHSRLVLSKSKLTINHVCFYIFI
jgi:hypothetical protein